MKSLLKGGLSSLIPSRSIKDPDDVLDEIDNEEMEEEVESTDEVEVESEEEVEVEEEMEEEEVVQSKKVSVVSEDVSEAVVSEEEELTIPASPNVTPLEIDIDVSDEDADLLMEEESPAIKAEVKVIKPKAVKTKKVEKVAQTKKEPKTEELVEKEVKVVKTVKSVKADEVSKKTTVLAKEEKVEKATAEKKKDTKSIWDKHESDVYHIKLSDISINPSQPRRQFDPAEMEELISSIETHGILQPLVVRRMKDNYELVAGERRLRAAVALEWDKVPCVVRTNVGSGATRLELALVENIQRSDLNPIEEAMAYKQLAEEYGMTHEEVGERVGKSRVGVTNAIRVLQLPDEIQKGLADGKITGGHARAILMIPDGDKQVRFYRHLVEEGLTVRKAETRARRIQRKMDVNDPMRRRRKGKSAFELKYSDLLEDRFGYDSKLKFNEEKNRFEIFFKCHSQDEIKELIGRLLGTVELPDTSDSDVIDD